MAATNAAVGTTQKLILPETYLDTIFEKITAAAVIPRLIPQKPKLYVNEEMLYMTEKPRAQYVGEGTPKNSTGWGFDSKPMHKFKLQTTVRVTEETVYANEDNPLGLFDKVLDELGPSLGEGVDSGMLHAVDPLSGEVMEDASKVAIALIGNQVEMTGDLMADLDSLPDSLVEDFSVNGVAFDPILANQMRKLRNKDGARLYPDIPLNLANDESNYEGLKAVTSKNVSGRFPWMDDTGVRAIMGDWNMAEWGIIRDIGLRRFDVGDPDNRGYDLSYKNEVAFRVEMLFAFGVAFDEAFAVLREKDTTDDDGGDDDGKGDDTPTPQSAKSSK